MGLSKEIILTVKDYEVKLNRDIKFYENDTIDLCFSILEYGIEVKDGVAVNKLMPINALKSYMLIETPQGVDYAESTKVENNRVVFNLGNKYSQFIGIGKMQIVIKDNDGCRVTLPEFPFEIRESINSDWDKDITVLSTEENEVIIDEFGRKIELKKISEMEETNVLPIDSYSMILDNNENKKIKTNLITQKIENDLQLINEQLDNKANEVDLKVERARIDSFIKLPEGSTTGDAELIDTRIGSYGLTYSTAGESVRTQISEVNKNILQVATSILNGTDVVLGNNTFFSMTSGTVHASKDINNPTPSTTGCYHKGYIDGGTTIYFDDTKYQLLAIYFNENKVGLEYKPWALTSPITLDEKYPYHVIQMKRKDNATIDILDVGNTTYKLNEKPVIKNNLNKNHIFYVSPEGDDNNDGLDKTTPLKTFQRAIDLGGTIIYGKRGIYPYQTIKADNKPELKIMPYDYEEYSTSQHERKKISFIGGTELSSLINEDGILKTTFAPAVRFHSVFVTKSLPPTFDQVISDKLLSNNAGLWQIHNDSSLDKMLTPVLSKGELVEGSFYCDGTYIFIKPYNTEYTKFISCNGTDDPIVKITNCGEVVLEDIEVLYSYYESFMIRNCMNTTIRNCKAGYNVLSSAINLDYTNANLYNCYATHCRKDGYGIGQYGVSNFYDCDAFYCMDDGMSHHFGCIASVYGGRYVGNGKGGNAPTYGAKVTIHNCFFKDNKFGIYAVSATDKVQGVEIPVYNCVFENNTRDILSDKTKVLLINCVKKGSTEQDSGQVVIY